MFKENINKNFDIVDSEVLKFWYQEYNKKVKNVLERVYMKEPKKLYFFKLSEEI